MLQLKGLYVALVTPFRNGTVDEQGLTRNIDFLIGNGVAGIVPCGTTGESATMSWEEHTHVMDVAIAHARGRCQVIPGAGSNNTAEAVDAARHAKRAGADAALVITPYYNKPTQEGLFQHFEKVAGEAGIPLVIYNVPSRTGVNITPATLERLCRVENIVAVKEASGNMNQVSEIANRCGDRLTILSGDDAMTLPILAVGGAGVISVSANIIPQDMSQMIKLWFEGNVAGARTWHHKMLNLCNALFIETNPIPVKTAMNLMGMAAGELRLPLVPLGEEHKKRLVAVMKEYGLKLLHG